jgi:hypothetical protein
VILRRSGDLELVMAQLGGELFAVRGSVDNYFKHETCNDRFEDERGQVFLCAHQKGHMEFFEAGKAHRERLMLAANRVGKTEGVGGYEMALHLTGQYPKWWTGRRYDKAIRAWAAGDTGKTVREILQSKLLGPVGSWGTGLIPGDSISRIVRGTGGVADTVEIVYVRHVSGVDSMPRSMRVE